MGIRVALHHKTSYHYDKFIQLNPHVVRLRPAPHCRTPIESYSLRIEPQNHFLNWQQDPQGNYLARLLFPEKTRHLVVEVDLVAEMTVINPFDFFLEPAAERFPFVYEKALAHELKPFLETDPAGPLLAEFLQKFPRDAMRTVDYLVEVNNLVHDAVQYTIRLDPGVQSPEETLTNHSGSCRDSAWLMVQALRQKGIAARFVSGYLIQLVPDVKSLDGPSGATVDFTDLHAWAEVYLPGAGWVGLDATSGLFAGEGHIPLACSPDPPSAAPITGSRESCESTFDFEMSITRVREDARVTKPYTEDEWLKIETLGRAVDADLSAGNVRLTMGGEPTFVSIDDMDGEEWTIAALGPNKRRLSADLLLRLKQRFGEGGFIHYGQGKWYPGEPLPRWALGCYWRTDGQPAWENPNLIADFSHDYGFNERQASQFVAALADRLGLEREYAIPAYEDPWHYIARERRLPTNVDPLQSRLTDKTERERLARVFERGLGSVVGYALPLEPMGGGWRSGQWFFRQENMFLFPGDSPMGLRLPLDSLPWDVPDPTQLADVDPFAPRGPLPPRRGSDFDNGRYTPGGSRRNAHGSGDNGSAGNGSAGNGSAGNGSAGNGSAGNGSGNWPAGSREANGHPLHRQARQMVGAADGGAHGGGAGAGYEYGDPAEQALRDPVAELDAQTAAALQMGQPCPGIVRTALCVEAREGRMFVFMPPVRRVEDYLELVSAIESTAAELQMPVMIEGYAPPHDPRLRHIKVTPDPGVIEVNVHPAETWNELVTITEGLYEDARLSRLGTEKFNLDGKHTGTGGGNHIVLGGATPADSPLLRRPDLLRSLVAYWHNHPSLSYLFSGAFIGPTSQAPRVDEARHDSVYELEIAMRQIPDHGQVPSWLVDRLFRHLLVDLTGNTHRAEFCIDKLFSPDSSTGRLGLIEFRAFEMPPHARMSLTQQLLLRAMIARFWKMPYEHPLVRWGTGLHDRFMLPHFVGQDFSDVLDELRRAGYTFDDRWFAPHHEFRFPLIGELDKRGLHLELRHAIEPWHVLGEESSSQGTARYVDSSLERLQVKVEGMTDPRHVVTCNGRRVPLHPTGVVGQYVAGVRYRAYQPPSCLHPTIPVDAPLVFDLIDTWSQRSIGGCTWHVSHPGGSNSGSFPVNAFAAESRRASRFFKMGHTPGPVATPPVEIDAEFPLTLDMRRRPASRP